MRQSNSQRFSTSAFWWVSTKPKRKLYGTLSFDGRSGATLKLDGRFQDFHKFQTAELLGSSNGAVILGTTRSGEKFSLMGTVETSSSRPVRRTKRARDSAIYRSTLVVRGDTFRHRATSHSMKYSCNSMDFKSVLVALALRRTNTIHTSNELPIDRPRR
jgi:hypothetical protein